MLDTTTTTTDTIDYVATDTWGNTATATRSVIIEPLAAPVTDSDTVRAIVADAPPLALDEPGAEDTVMSDAFADPADASAQE